MNRKHEVQFINVFSLLDRLFWHVCEDPVAVTLCITENAIKIHTRDFLI